MSNQATIQKKAYEMTTSELTEEHALLEGWTRHIGAYADIDETTRLRIRELNEELAQRYYSGWVATGRRKMA